LLRAHLVCFPNLAHRDKQRTSGRPLSCGACPIRFLVGGDASVTSLISYLIGIRVAARLAHLAFDCHAVFRVFNTRLASHDFHPGLNAAQNLDICLALIPVVTSTNLALLALTM